MTSSIDNMIDRMDVAATASAIRTLADTTPIYGPGPLVQLARNVWGIGPVVRAYAEWQALAADLLAYNETASIGTSQRFDNADKLTNMRPLWTEEHLSRRIDALVERMHGLCVTEGGPNCVEGTNDFLAAFGWPMVDACAADDGCGDDDCDTCNPEVTHYVQVTLTCTVEVSGRQNDDTYDVRQGVEGDMSILHNDDDVTVDTVRAEYDRCENDY